MNKALLFATLLTMLALAEPSHAQDSLWDAVKQSAETINQNQEEQDNETEGGDEGEPGEPGAQNEWAEDWEATTEEYAEVFDVLGRKPDRNCVAMMVLYVYDYVNLLQQTENEANCRQKYDLYGMQLLAMASSTTIMYCPEGLAQKTDEQLRDITADYYQVVVDYSDFELDEYGEEIYPDMGPEGDLLTAWQSLRLKTELLWMYIQTAVWQAGEQGTLSDEERDRLRRGAGLVRYLVSFFDPTYIVPRTFTVGQLMEELEQTCGP